MQYLGITQQQKDRLKEKFKSHPVVMTLRTVALVGIVIGAFAGTGALAGLVFASLPPLIIGGIVGFALSLLAAMHTLASRYINFTNMRENPEESFIDSLKKTELKATYCVNNITDIGVCFGIGAGLVALGFTSPVAIGALTAIAGPVISFPLALLINKAIECCASRENEQSGIRVDKLFNFSNRGDRQV